MTPASRSSGETDIAEHDLFFLIQTWRSGIRNNVCVSWNDLIDNLDREESWYVKQSKFPKHLQEEPRMPLICSERIMPLPKPGREYLIDEFCSTRRFTGE